MFTSPLELEHSLKSAVSGDVFCDLHHRGLYATDASIYQIAPAAVVAPTSTADVVAAVKIAAAKGIPVTPRGGGTSLSGQSIGPGIVLDFSKYMNRVTAIDPERRVARIEPGIVLDSLNAAAARHMLQFGPDVATSSRANLGGMIGNNSAGTRSIRNGKTVDHVISLDVVFADGSTANLHPLAADQVAACAALPGPMGMIHQSVPRIVAENRDEILARYPRILRRVAGYNLDEFVPEFRAELPLPLGAREAREIAERNYPGAEFNLARLIVGAEGTLACVTGAEVALVSLPRQRGVVVLEFDSLDAAVASLAEILPLDPSAAELLDGMIPRLAAKNLEYCRYLDFVQGRPESLMLVEFSGDQEHEVLDRVAELERRLAGCTGLTHFLRAIEPRLRDHVWACRKASLPLLMSVPGARKPIAFVEDTAVPPARLAEFVRRFKRIIDEEGTEGAYYGHASVGCLHIRPLLDTASGEDLKRLERISRAVCDLALEFGGTMCGEHGDGLARGYLLERQFGPRLYQAFREIKQAFDPAGIMNPGKIIDAPSPVANLRYGVDYRRPPLATALDFSGEGGLLLAAESCNGAGVCRKTLTGTMCPSFMATGDEEHSTRGRANALRLTLSGKLPVGDLGSEELFRTFDLCLMCKGCKAECPSNVDVAKMKVEFLHQRRLIHGTTLGARLMGNIATVNRIGSGLAPVSNWFAGSAAARWLNERILGIDRRRSMPRFRRDHFRRWFAGHTPHPAAGRAGEVLLLADCLTSYGEPEVNRDAVRLLEAAGYKVQLADVGCCGRPLLSKGLVPEAKRLARRNVDRLLPVLGRGTRLVGCEPSCVSAILDDYLDLGLGEDAKRLAGQTTWIERFLLEAGVFPSLASEAADVLLHGHCHQKALAGTADTVQLLGRAPGVSVRVADSGCCGMAGSFGYEHYDMSMKIGERVLFPAIRERSEAVIVAPGTSCRHQIADGTERRALHPIQFLASRLT